MANPVTLCMIDSAGRRQDRPLIKMQSLAGLRQMIVSGDRVAECFAEMQMRNERVRYVRAMLRSQFGDDANVGQ